MKKYTLLLILFTAASYLATAQQQTGERPAGERITITPEKRAELRTMSMERDLQLTAEQKDKIYQENLKAETALQESLSIRDKETRKTRFDEINSEREAGYKQVLTESQYSIHKQRNPPENVNRSTPDTEKNAPRSPAWPPSGQPGQLKGN